MTEDTLEGQAQCPYCAEWIRAEAVKCRYCGEFLTEELRRQQRNEAQPAVTTSFNPGLALVLGLLFTGAGQFYTMRPTIGIVAFIIMMFLAMASMAGRPLIPLVFLFHVAMAFEAYYYRPAGTASKPDAS